MTLWKTHFTYKSPMAWLTSTCICLSRLTSIYPDVPYWLYIQMYQQNIQIYNLPVNIQTYQYVWISKVELLQTVFSSIQKTAHCQGTICTTEIWKTQNKEISDITLPSAGYTPSEGFTNEFSYNIVSTHLKDEQWPLYYIFKTLHFKTTLSIGPLSPVPNSCSCNMPSSDFFSWRLPTM